MPFCQNGKTGMILISSCEPIPQSFIQISYNEIVDLNFLGGIGNCFCMFARVIEVFPFGLVICSIHNQVEFHYNIFLKRPEVI